MPRSGTLTIARNGATLRKRRPVKAIRDYDQNVGMIFQQYNQHGRIYRWRGNLIEACRVLGRQNQALARAKNCWSVYV